MRKLEVAECPLCHSKSVEPKSVLICGADGKFTREYECLDCGKKFKLVLTIEQVTSLV